MMNTKAIKRTSVFILVLLLAVMSFSLVSFGASKEPIMDYIRVFDDEDLASLNEYAVAIGDNFGIDIALLITDSSYAQDQDLDEYARECYFAHRNLSDNGFILAVDNDEWTWKMIFFGNTVGILDDEEMEAVYEAYDNSDTFFDGVVGYYQAVESILLARAGGNGGSVGSGAYLVVDQMGLLTADQASSLADRLLKVSDKYDFDVVVAVVDALDGKEAHLYAADFFEENGYGRGKNDGCILLLAMEDRDFGFAALGYGNTAFTEYGQDYLGNFYLPYLKQDMYYEAFMSYGDGVEDFLRMAKAGTPYDKGNIPGEEEKEPTSKRGIFGTISVAISALIAKITTGSWKSQLKGVRSERGARKYVRQGSLNLTEQKDVFLYRNTNSVVIPKKTESTQGQSFTTSKGSKATGHSGKF